MFKKCIIKKDNVKSIIFIGFILMILGLVPTFIVDEDLHNIYMAAGFLFGLGVALFAMALMQLMKYRKMSDIELKDIEIEMNDERNIKIEQMAYSLTFRVSMLLIGLVSFILILLNYIVPAYFVLGMFVLLSMIFRLSAKHYNKKY